MTAAVKPTECTCLNSYDHCAWCTATEARCAEEDRRAALARCAATAPGRDLLSVQEVAYVVGMKQATVYYRTKAHTLPQPIRRAGKRHWWKRADVERFIDGLPAVPPVAEEEQQAAHDAPAPTRPTRKPAPTEPAAHQFIDAAEVARLVGMGVRTVWRMVEQGRLIPPVRFSRKLVRWDRAAVVAWIEKTAADASAA